MDTRKHKCNLKGHPLGSGCDTEIAMMLFPNEVTIFAP